MNSLGKNPSAKQSGALAESEALTQQFPGSKGSFPTMSVSGIAAKADELITYKYQWASSTGHCRLTYGIHAGAVLGIA